MRLRGALVVALACFWLLPSPPSQCYSSEAYRNTHERECVIDAPKAGWTPNSPPAGGGNQPGGLRRILHDLTGGLL